MVDSNILLPLSVFLMATLCQCEPPVSIFQRAVRSAPEQCTIAHPSDFKFSITSNRNKTGHWTAEVRLQHGEDENEHEKGQWQVDLEQITTKCQGVKSVQVVATITAPSPSTPAGFEMFPGVGYYKFHKIPKTWDESRKICEEEGGHLVIINSEEESTVLQNLFSKVPKTEGATNNDYIFVGIHDRFVEGEFITIFGKPLSSTGFIRWAGPGQPDNAGGAENCGSMHRNGGLNDIPCPWNLPFVCELEI